MFLLTNNGDSFTYDLHHFLGELGAELEVVHNDQIAIDKALAKGTSSGIILSPGPCTPNEAGICLEVAETALRNPPPRRGLPRPPIPRPSRRLVQSYPRRRTNARQSLQS